MVMAGRIAKASAALNLPVVACRHISRSARWNDRQSSAGKHSLPADFSSRFRGMGWSAVTHY